MPDWVIYLIIGLGCAVGTITLFYIVGHELDDINKRRRK